MARERRGRGRLEVNRGDFGPDRGTRAGANGVRHSSLLAAGRVQREGGNDDPMRKGSAVHRSDNGRHGPENR